VLQHASHSSVIDRRRPWTRRPSLRVETLVLVIAAYLVATANGSWWRQIMQGREWSDAATWFLMVASLVALVALHFTLLIAFANRWIIKPLLSALVVASAAAAYYMHAYAVIMDPSMVQNVLRTDTREAGELLGLGMVGSVILWSAAPLVLIWWVRIVRLPWSKAAVVRVASIAGALVVAGLAILSVSRDITSFMRNHREARYLITPANLVYGLAVDSAGRVQDLDVVREPVGLDASIIRAGPRMRPRVLVLVVGETARAGNFSLLGYPRDTNPKLARLGVTAFANVTACGTSTEISVPCMFSPFGRADYDQRRIRNSEGLLDVLKRAGYAVRWIDNQSGCKGVCKGIDYAKVDPATEPDSCEGGECLDGVLIRRLEAELAQVRGDTVLVLHMMGNHGPAYFRRYPAEFRRFTPDCATAELRKCTVEEVVNAYDNAILYTDHVLAGLIDTLSRDPERLDAAMMYVSDHGESLGEKGLYLHGLPHFFAPSEQTHVPLLVWLSSALTTQGDVSDRCVRSRAQAAYSHDNLFHSVLGLMNVRTGVYRAELDIFDGCRGGTYSAQRDSPVSASTGSAPLLR
jgi:lipid A ethanolaminephosphotransferase